MAEPTQLPVAGQVAGALTVSELAAALEAQGILAPADVSVFAEYLFAEYEAQREALILAYYDTIASQMTGQMSAEILANAANLANTAADSLLRTMALGDIETMGATIAQGLADGLGPFDIARQLDMVQGLDAQRAKSLANFRSKLDASDMTTAQIERAEEREFKRLLKARRETIARTEAANSVNAGDWLEAKRTDKKWKVWQTTGDARVSAACQANEAQGEIPINDSFTSGASTPPQHPNCRCSVSYTKITGPGAERDSKKRIAKTAAAKEGKKK